MTKDRKEQEMDRDHHAEPGQTDSVGRESAAIRQATEHRRREADRLSRREEVFWTRQRFEIQRRLAEVPPRSSPFTATDTSTSRGFEGDRSRPAFRLFGPAFTGSAAVATLMVATFSLGPLIGPVDRAPSSEERSTAELRRLFADVGRNLARHEPLALAPAVPVQQALDSAWAFEDRRADSPWNTTVKLHSQKEF